MNPVTVPLLARLFQIAGGVLGLPSLGVLVLYAVHRLQGWLAAPAPVRSEGGEGLLGLFQGAMAVVQGVAGLLGAIADIVLTMAALAAAVGLVLALACWCTGRGLRRHAGWARVGGSALLVLAGLAALLLALSLGGVGRLLLLAPLLFCGLGLQALWVGAAARAGDAALQTLTTRASAGSA